MKVDFVIPWVDGNDSKWQAEKQMYMHDEVDDSNLDNRYRDWGLLPYWFRAVEKFTPWVNKIYFITWGHIPAFLNTEHEKIEIVNHKDYLPKKYIPTFSSHVIELNLHRISDLSEHFVYFNDDTFILRPMDITKFFQDDLPCTYGAEIPITFSGTVGTWQHAAVNDLGVINANFIKKESVRQFGKKYVTKNYRWQDNIRTGIIEKIYPDYFTGFKNLHAPNPFLKSTFDKVWEKEYELLDATCQNKFRTCRDLNQWVMLWWQIADGKFYPSSVDNYVNSVSEEIIADLCYRIETQKHDMICINDPEKNIDFDSLSKKLVTSFEKILPEKSRFER